MRTVFVLASHLSGSALADTVRHPSVPERFWGTWAPTADLCRDDKSIIIVSAKGYVTAQASCMVQWVIATAGAGGPIYSAHMRCSSPSTPDQDGIGIGSSCRLTMISSRRASTSRTSRATKRCPAT